MTQTYTFSHKYHKIAGIALKALGVGSNLNPQMSVECLFNSYVIIFCGFLSVCRALESESVSENSVKQHSQDLLVIKIINQNPFDKPFQTF